MMFHLCPPEAISKSQEMVKQSFTTTRGYSPPETLKLLPFNFKYKIVADMYESFIEKSQLFHGLERGCKKEILTRVTPISLLKNQPVIELNDMNVALFVVTSGMLNVHAHNGELQYENLLPGSSFGEVSLLAGRMTYCVTSMQDSMVLVLFSKDVEELFNAFPSLSVILRQRAKARLLSLKDTARQCAFNLHLSRQRTDAIIAQLEGMSVDLEDGGAGAAAVPVPGTLGKGGILGSIEDKKPGFSVRRIARKERNLPSYLYSDSSNASTPRSNSIINISDDESKTINMRRRR